MTWEKIVAEVISDTEEPDGRKTVNAGRTDVIYLHLQASTWNGL